MLEKLIELLSGYFNIGDSNGYKCSKCGFWGVPGWIACPKCAARMDGEQHGQV